MRTVQGEMGQGEPSGVTRCPGTSWCGEVSLGPPVRSARLRGRVTSFPNLIQRSALG